MRLIDWLFRDRRNGGYTVAQLPNWPLGIWMATTALLWVLHPKGAMRVGFHLVATGALLVWAVDEVARGVNPWRRLLGAVVATAVVVSIVAR